MNPGDWFGDWLLGSTDHIGKYCNPDLSCCIDIKTEFRVDFEFRKRFLEAIIKKDALSMHTLGVAMLNSAELSAGMAVTDDLFYNITMN